MASRCNGGAGKNNLNTHHPAARTINIKRFELWQQFINVEIQKGKVVGWRAVVRIDGHPAICKQHDRKEEAQDWAMETERQIKQGQFNFELHKNKRTFNELLERYRNDGALEHIRSVEDVIRHLEYWTNRFGSYALVHLTSELIGKERRLLAEKPTHKGENVAIRL